MKYAVSAAVAALLASTASAYSANTGIAFAGDLDCTSCIRGGFDYCINGTQVANVPTGTSWQCLKEAQNPEYVWPETGGKASGYICSNAMSDQMAAIVAGCRPNTNNVQEGYTCGSYFVDLTVESFPTRLIKNMTVNQTCTYRAYTTCGWPAVGVSIGNETFMSDFDIIYAANDFAKENDLGSDFLLNDTTSWNGNFNSDTTTFNKQLSAGFDNDAIDAATLYTCKGTPKNLWISVTRVKESKVVKAEQFLAETPRQL